FYALHKMVVPGLIAALIGAHLFLVVKLGTTAPPWIRAGRPKGARPVELVDAGMPSDDVAEIPADSISGGGPAEADAEAVAVEPEAPDEAPEADADSEGTDGKEVSS
ncbi:MAG: cytochrome b, partial [Actinomycetota bacterium]|nr:cytochrome b [Actinomycetota bacterium]